MHLDAPTLQALRDQTLPTGEARALAAHLDGGCEDCERFLAGLGEADALDGLVDGALGRLARSAAPAQGAGHDLEFARIMGRVRRPTSVRRWVTGLAIAATVALAGVSALLPRSPAPDRWDGMKGAAMQPVPLRLRFLVLSPASGGSPGGSPALERGVSGQAVPAAASLQFQVELGREAEVVLAHDVGGRSEPFFRARLPAGRSVVTVAGQPAAFPLARLSGPQRFLALASEQPIEPGDVARAVAGTPAPPQATQPISLDQVEVIVK
jgi:hypothetical protein